MKNFVTFEGCDGVGKTYQINKLREYCKQQNFTDVVFTREPGGSSIAEQIRNIILDAKNKEMDDLCEAFLYASARIQHLHDIVRPALAEGKVVFCDRFVHSSYCYQGLGRGLGYERVVALNKLAVVHFVCGVKHHHGALGKKSRQILLFTHDDVCVSYTSLGKCALEEAAYVFVHAQHGSTPRRTSA